MSVIQLEDKKRELTEQMKSFVTKREELLQQRSQLADICGWMKKKRKKCFPFIFFSKPSKMAKKVELEADTDVTEETAKKERKNCLKMVQRIELFLKKKTGRLAEPYIYSLCYPVKQFWKESFCLYFQPAIISEFYFLSGLWSITTPYKIHPTSWKSLGFSFTSVLSTHSVGCLTSLKV